MFLYLHRMVSHNARSPLLITPPPPALPYSPPVLGKKTETNEVRNEQLISQGHLDTIGNMKLEHARQISNREAITESVRQEVLHLKEEIRSMQTKIDTIDEEIRLREERIRGLQEDVKERNHQLDVLMQLPAGCREENDGKGDVNEKQDFELQEMINVNNIRISVLENKNRDLRRLRVQRGTFHVRVGFSI